VNPLTSFFLLPTISLMVTTTRFLSHTQIVVQDQAVSFYWGSILGTLLVVIHINDMSSIVSSHLFKFAMMLNFTIQSQIHLISNFYRLILTHSITGLPTGYILQHIQL